MEKEYLDEGIFIIYDFLSEDEISQHPNNITEIKNKISKLFNDEYKLLGTGMLRTMLEGDYLEPHSDTHDEGCECSVCVRDGLLTCKYGLVIYLNEDFEGGQINYIKKNITYKPKKRSLVCHIGTNDYEHQVLPITKGTRKSIFFYLRD